MRNSASLVMTILGSGTSSGVPLIGCKCKVCRSRDTKNHRLRASAWIEARGKSLLIDTSTDLRQQALRHRIDRVDAVLFTHPHADHIHGIDELRAYNFLQKSPIPVYGNDWTCEDLTRKFEYVLGLKNGKPIPPAIPGQPQGGGLPQLALHRFDPTSPRLELSGMGDLTVTPIALQHGRRQSVGYRLSTSLASLAYVTDCKVIPPASLERLRGLDTLVLDCVRIAPHHGTHFNIDEALATIREVRPKKAYLTHLGHEFDHTTWNRKLPKGIQLAYDGLKIRLN